MNITNFATIAGYLYDVKDLEYKTVKNQASANFGKPFIGGRIVIATDENGLNLVNVEYPYVTPTTKNGKPDSRYAALSRILEEKLTWVNVGKDDAMKVSLKASAAANDYYDQSGALVTRNSLVGGFDLKIVNTLPPENQRDYFRCLVLLHTCTHVEADEEKNIDEDFLRLSGYTFNYNGTVMHPLSFVMHDHRGFDVFEGYEMTKSQPVLTTIWGHLVAQVRTQKQIIESSFGDDSVQEKQQFVYEWVITGSAKIPLEYDSEDTITAEAVTKMLQDREVMLASRKQSWEERKNKSTETKTVADIPSTGSATDNDFDF